jgi:hypothetical protein
LLDLTQANAAEIFGGGQNAFSKYERGEVVQSLAMDRILRFFAAAPDCFDTFVNIQGSCQLKEKTSVVDWDLDLETYREREIDYKNVGYISSKLEYTWEDIYGNAA